MSDSSRWRAGGDGDTVRVTAVTVTTTVVLTATATPVRVQQHKRSIILSLTGMARWLGRPA